MQTRFEFDPQKFALPHALCVSDFTLNVCSPVFLCFHHAGLDEIHGSALATAWEGVGAQLTAAQVGHSHPSIASPLIDAEWRFGVTVSSDDVSKVGSTYVQLKLAVERDGVVCNEWVELTLSKFYDLLSKLERAKSYVDYLSGTATLTSS